MDSSDASTSDSSSDESTPALTASRPTETVISTNKIAAPIPEDADSDSDISMSADSDDEDSEAPNTSTIQVNQDMDVLEQPAKSPPADSAAGTTSKRKFPGATDNVPNGRERDTRKRIKPDEPSQSGKTQEGRLPIDRSQLPAEIWHYIFTFVPPRSLGLLLSVNRSFNAFLNPCPSGRSISPLSRSVLSPVTPDAIWRASRRLFLPGMPSPLDRKSELDMFKLACSSSCQFCGKKRHPNPTPAADVWHPGPGENGVIPIWLFGVVTCGTCIQQRCTKEIDLLLSSSVPSPLMPALPFVFLTNELHVLPLATLQNSQQPSKIQVAKNFFQPQIEDIKREFLDVKSMGSATAEEWLKGLEDRGKERRNDSARWERWEASGGITRIRLAELQSTSKPATQPSNIPAITPNSVLGATTNGNTPVLADDGHNVPQAFHLPPPIHTSLPPHPQRFGSPSQNGLTPQSSRAYAQPRHERTKEEVAELKATRRAEIERRCMLLDPPLTAGVLSHMPSFQAAIQIIQPLDDGAWKVLEPRLISQRHDAEQRENERLAQTRVVQERFEETSHQDVQPRPESKDIDREWEDIQAPLRLRIGGYADETIRDAWAGGNKVTKDNCPAFAAEVLIYVRKRFYAEVAKDEAAIRAAGREPEMDPPGGPFTRKLTLENMKWVFDTKIKPYTEQYRKELFLCSECHTNFKFYGFEGVIQHYAAKHTNELSVGSIVVHWKAEWPEDPPFNPEPLSSKTSHYPPPPSASIPYPVTVPQQSYGYGGYQPSPLSTSVPVTNPHGYQENPAPYYGQPQYGDQYSGHQHDPYNSAYTEPPQGYPPLQYSAPPQMGHSVGYNEPPQDYAQTSYGPQYPATTQGYYGPPPPGPVYPPSAPEVAPQQQPYAPSGNQYGYPYGHPPVQVPPTPVNQFSPAPVPERTEEYKARLQDIAKSAREVWDAINNMKDIPGSVKVYTILYHLLNNSRAQGLEDPPLLMIIDGMSNNKSMRKVRNINGLLCKACALGMPGSSSNSQKKHYSFPQLVNHFHTVHEPKSQNDSGYTLDWSKDMVELPDLTRLAPILEKPGVSEHKVRLIAEALPEIFARPEPSIPEPCPSQPSYYGGQGHHGLAPSQDNHDKYYAAVDSGNAPAPSSGTYDNGQYDPRNPRDPREERIPDDAQPRYRVVRRAEEYYPAYESRRISSPSHLRPSDTYERGIIREEASSYLERPVRYRDEEDFDYRIRREPAVLSYEDPPVRRPEQDVLAPVPRQEVSHNSHIPPAEDTVAQQNRVFEVVAQITQQAKEARERKPIKQEPGLGPEEGELEPRPTSKVSEKTRANLSAEASSAAERFLNELQPGDASGTAKAIEAERPREDRLARGDERVGSIPLTYPPLAEGRRPREAYDEDGRAVISRGRPITEDEAGYIVRERVAPPRQSPSYAYDDRYMTSVQGQGVPRDRSPELVDRRYKLNNVIYREERPAAHGMRRTPSQFARYESVRLENDRARSRSPVYVKVGAPPGQYRERSPAHPLQEAVYETRAPHLENVAYERAPRQEYYRVYTDDPRPRQPQYVEAYEYVQVSDPKGDYMIRRPVRREREPEPIYAAYEGEQQYARKPVYEDEQYARPPVYETRAPISRTDPAYYEEYDPRHPAPPPSAPPARQRYQ